jgi:hypothetical protein
MIILSLGRFYKIFSPFYDSVLNTNHILCVINKIS